MRTIFYLPIAGMLLTGVAFATLAVMFMWPFGWLWCLIAGRTPRWYQRAATWLVVFIAQSMAFGLLVTDRLPSRSGSVTVEVPWAPTPLPAARDRMPGPKGMKQGLFVAGAIGLAVVSVVTGVLLWHTTVPTDLKLPKLKASHYFDEFQLSDIGAENTADRWFLLGQLASIVALALFAWRGARLVRHSAAGPIGSGIFLGTLGVGCAALASAPFLPLGLSALPAGVDTGPIGLDVPLQVLGSMSSVAIVVVAGMAIARRAAEPVVAGHPVPTRGAAGDNDDRAGAGAGRGRSQAQGPRPARGRPRPRGTRGHPAQTHRHHRRARQSDRHADTHERLCGRWRAIIGGGAAGVASLASRAR